MSIFSRTCPIVIDLRRYPNTDSLKRVGVKSNAADGRIRSANANEEIVPTVAIKEVVS